MIAGLFMSILVCYFAVAKLSNYSVVDCDGYLHYYFSVGLFYTYTIVNDISKLRERLLFFRNFYFRVLLVYDCLVWRRGKRHPLFFMQIKQS